MNEPTTMVIDSKGLSKEFKGVKALENLTLQVPKNSIHYESNPRSRARRSGGAPLAATYPLAQAAEAHRFLFLKSRKAKGKVLLFP